jgi:predicted RNA binding protein YcfA (HicA-like mRNA interferase family)
MPRLPVLSGREVIKALKKAGFEERRQKGSHIILVKELAGGRKAVIVPNHREVDIGTLIEILRQAGLKRDEFLELL